MISFTGRTQIYPVQISTQLVPPYSGYLPDYADPSSEKLKLILQFNDFSVPQYQLKLVFEIKGNGFSLKTKTFYNPPPIILQPGQPILLSSSDLAPYLSSNNLDFVGINLSQYERRMALPEGYYSICVKAYDYYNPNNVQVSNEACAQAWFTLSDPPFLNLPICNSTVKPLDPQNLLFQWTPMNLGSPLSAMNTEYEFALWECRPDSNVNPNQIVLSTPPVYSTTTKQTFINYGITEPALNLYMKYIWRVKAKDNTGRDWFKNNGYSQICTFKYGTLSNVIGDVLGIKLIAKSFDHRSGSCEWNKQSAYLNYLLQVRKKGTNFWFDYENISGIERIKNLEPLTTYECRVRGEGNGLTGNWSNVAEFTTEAAPVYGCNDQTLPYGNNPEPLPFIKALPGIVIQSGQFEVIATKIEANGSPGWYKGQGYTKVFGKRIMVKWDNIFIDAEQRQQQGIIEALTDGIEKWMEQWDITEAEENATYENGVIDSVFINGNEICYTLQGSDNLLCVQKPSNANVKVIRDGEGNQYEIKFIPLPTKISGPKSYLTYSNDSLQANYNQMVSFSMSNDQNFGFDKKEYAAFIKNYEVIQLSNKKNYFVSNKSIGAEAADEVMANIKVPDNNYDQVSFRTKDGTLLINVAGNVPGEIKIVEIPANAECVYAWYNNKKIGKLNVFSLKNDVKKIVLVPVNGTTLPQNLQLGLNSIFKQSNISWSVSAAPNFTFDLKDGLVEAANVNFLSRYSAEMKEIRTAYKDKDTAYDKAAHYIFVVPGFSDPNQIGYMARGKALGFVKSGADLKAYAHELGHGAFAFEHTFPAVEKHSTNNLMDYGSGTNMVHEQWVKTKIPPAEFNWFDDEDAGSFMGNERDAELVFEILNRIKVTYKNGTNFGTGNYVGIAAKAKNCFLGGTHYDYIDLKIINLNNKPIRPRNKIVADKAVLEQDGKLVDVVNVDDLIKIYVPPVRINHLIGYLKDTTTFKNLMVFVNGYRPIVNFNDGLLEKYTLEYSNTENQCEIGDCRGYWKGIDARFINRIGTKNVVYFDGHHSVSTSNHGSVYKYLTGNLASDNIRLYHSPKEGTAEYSIQIRNKDYLHTMPNISGFNIRKASGEIGAKNLIKKINSGVVVFNKEKDSVDVVAHSMGYAYAVGLISELKKEGFKFGRFYILAPENACGGGVPLIWFNEVWQYGSNLGMEQIGKVDPPWLQDGVAPQCDVPNIRSQIGNTKFGRVAIPDNIETKGYLGSHSVGNYYWIFDKIVIPSQEGYVKKR